VTPDLGRYAATLRRQWLLALAVIAAGAFTGYAVASAQTPAYSATAKVLLDQDRRVDALLGTDAYAPDPERELNTGVLLITQPPIADRVRRSLGLAGPLRVSTAPDSNSSIVAITATDADPERSARIANAFAAEYARYRSQTARRAVDDALTAARGRRDALADPGELDAEIRRLETLAAFASSGVQLVARADAADAARRPRPLLAGFVGGFLGLLLAAVVVVVLTRTDPRVRRDSDVELATGRPVISPTALALWLRGPVVLLLGDGSVEAAYDVARALAIGDRSAIVIETSDDPLAVPIETACAEAELVLLAGGALELATLADQVVLVARLGVTRADRLGRTVRELGVAGMPPAAVVVIDRAPAHRDAPVSRRQEVAVG
jgi:capsular polysaccharide biosynthesis protein